MRLWERVKKPKFYLKGLATYLPDSLGKYLPQHQPQFRGAGIRKDENVREAAAGLYTSWMRTMIVLHQQGGVTYKNVAEIGPGDSLGVGLAALLSGANSFLALDAVPTAYNLNNEEIFEELVSLFKKRAPLLSQEQCPKQRPHLKSYNFPTDILTDEKLKVFLADDRLEKIRIAIRAKGGREKNNSGQISIDYSVPWDKAASLFEYRNSVDLIISSAALEHVDDVVRTYYAANELLRDGGVIASSIDFKCHDTAGLRNGHFAYSDLEWKVVRGRSVFFINRWPHEWHIKEMKKYFTILHDDVYHHPRQNLQLERKDLAPRFSGISDEELAIAEAFIIGKKHASSNTSP